MVICVYFWPCDILVMCLKEEKELCNGFSNWEKASVVSFNFGLFHF